MKSARRKPGTTWHLDEVFVSLRSEPYLLWRVVDQHGAEIDILLQKRRDKAASKRFFKRALASCAEAPRNDTVPGYGILLSTDGKGSWRDNVFVERLWRSVKYDETYLKAYESVGQARRSIADYLKRYNQRRPHSSLADRTPDEAYFAMLPAIKTAARRPAASTLNRVKTVRTNGATSVQVKFAFRELRLHG